MKVRADSGFPVAVDDHRVHGRHGGDHHYAAAQGDAGDEALHAQDRPHLRHALHLPIQARGECRVRPMQHGYVSDGYGYLDTPFLKKTPYVDMFYYFYKKI